MKAKTINMEMSSEQNKTISQQINNFFAEENYLAAIELLRTKLSEYPDDHWLLAQLSICFYEQKEYQTALEFSQKAVTLKPQCPLALNYHATILFANKQNSEALKVWQNLLETAHDQLAYGECGEGSKFAQSLQNDIRFMQILI